MVSVGQQGAGDSMETRVGNVGLTVRGTLYTMGVDDDGIVYIVMLSGAGEVNGVFVNNGYMVTITDCPYDPVFEVIPFSLENVSLFTLHVMLENSAYLLEIGTITPEMLEALPGLIE